MVIAGFFVLSVTTEFEYRHKGGGRVGKGEVCGSSQDSGGYL